MDNMEEVLQAITIASVVSLFLINTSRGLQAIKLCQECLVLLKTNILGKEDQFTKVYHAINQLIFIARYCLISDYTNVERHVRKILLMFHDSGDTDAEGKLSLKLAQICQSQNKFVEAKQHSQKFRTTTPHEA